jgi:glycosyltransferase involved in cell wall biosynthesis
MYRCEAYVAEAIESIHAQTAAPLEIVAVDDGSPDESARIAERLGARVFHQQQAGIGPARNRGIAAARGELLAFLDADDVWPRDALETQLGALGDADGVIGHVRQFVSSDLAPEEAARIVCPDAPQWGGAASAMMIRRTAFDRVGDFSAVPVGEYVEWYARARDAGVHFARNEAVVLHRRLHRGNTVRERREQQGEYLRILKGALDRRRGAGM